jgi:prolyl 4-hydroxylase
MNIYIILFIILSIIIIILLINNDKKDKNLKNNDNVNENVNDNVNVNYNNNINNNINVFMANINDDYVLPSLHQKLITDEEAKYIITKSTDHFEDSVVISGYHVNIRKSKTAWISKFNPIVKNIILKVCQLTNTPFENAEHLQVVKYDTNGYYNEHYDSAADNSSLAQEFLKLGGHRIVTMLIYLNDEFTGGATRFINLNKDIKPPKNAGLLFFTLDKNLKKCHPKALHAGLPILSGNKYIANVWIRQMRFPHENILENLVV